LGASVYAALVWYQNPTVLLDMAELVVDRRKH
jgi:hypothetical protein